MQDKLPELIGKALGKPAVLVALIDVSGAILVNAYKDPDAPTYVRDNSMVNQMSKLLGDHMKEMMQVAGKEFSAISSSKE